MSRKIIYLFILHNTRYVEKAEGVSYVFLTIFGGGVNENLGGVERHQGGTYYI